MEKSSTLEKPVLAIVGPTASGKSGLAIFLAQKLGGEVISADSRQVYAGLDIGTGKVTSAEMAGIRHHLLDIAQPQTQYAVTDFMRDVKAAIDNIRSRGKLPIICGGTGLYIDSLLEGLTIPEVPPNEELRKKLEEKSTEELFALLTQKDPRRAEAIDRHNPRRLVRALEITAVLGTVPKLSKSQKIPAIRIGIQIPKEELKEKIAKRLHERLEAGMIEEVETLLEQGVTHERLESLGLEYRYVSRHLRGLLSREVMTRELLKAICDYADRQMTWFKRNKEIQWVKTPEEALGLAKEI